ncbi:MAG: hypothetical protein ABIL44_12645 [candidate division WOR-3 bacterium]
MALYALMKRNKAVLVNSLISLVFIILSCGTNIIGAKFYHLLEKERILYLGLLAIDSLAAYDYLNLPSPTERKYFYDRYWQGKDDERQEIEKRTQHAFKEFGRYAPLEDMRIPIYVKYGAPTRRYMITPEKKIGITTKEFVRPGEIWTYKEKGVEFDFVKIDRAYKIIARTTFGDSVIIPFLKEEKDSSIVLPDKNHFKDKLKCAIAVGRFRQAKNLVRLEIYAKVFIKAAQGCTLVRRVTICDLDGNTVKEKIDRLSPSDTLNETFYYDEINFWLAPATYNVLVEYYDLKTNEKFKKENSVVLVDYKEDAKKVSDLIFACLIDDGYTDEKFYKSPGRVIPMLETSVFCGQPFYLYHELYNLKVDENNMHFLKTVYEIYNKEKMRKEIVDILVHSETGEGDVAYLSAKYHPMDLPSGEYMCLVRTTDMLSKEEYTAVGEFILEAKR